MLARADGFAGWEALNDTIMGGNSQGHCTVDSEGMLLNAEVVEAGGGFVSCRSPRYVPPLDLSTYDCFRLELEADGRRYKLAVACADGVGGLSEWIPGGLRWVAEFGTQAQGTTQVILPFDQLKPSQRAQPLRRNLPLVRHQISRLQVLHSRFGDDGQPNQGFRPGPLRLRIRSIHAGVLGGPHTTGTTVG